MQNRFEASSALWRLERSVGGSRFGYRVQALLALALRRLGAKVEAVMATGHPDIKATILGTPYLIQVKTLSSQLTRRHFEIANSDIVGITAKEYGGQGLFVILDLGPPLRWICVRSDRLRTIRSAGLPLEALRAMEERAFSEDWTTAFCEIVEELGPELERMDFATIVQRATAP